MCSSLTQRGAKVTIEALASGAADYVTKPAGQPSRRRCRSVSRPRAGSQNSRPHRSGDRCLDAIPGSASNIRRMARDLAGRAKRRRLRAPGASSAGAGPGLRLQSC